MHAHRDLPKMTDFTLADVLQRLRATYADRCPSYHVLRAAIAEGQGPCLQDRQNLDGEA